MPLTQRQLEVAKRYGLKIQDETIEGIPSYQLKEGVDFENLKSNRLIEKARALKRTLGYSPTYSSGYRTQEEQDLLPTTDKSKVSAHSYGNAMDQSIRSLTEDQIKKTLDYYNEDPALKAFVHEGTAPHMHIEDKLPDESTTIKKPLTQRQIDIAKRYGLEIPGEQVQAKKQDGSYFEGFPGILESAGKKIDEGRRVLAEKVSAVPDLIKQKLDLDYQEPEREEGPLKKTLRKAFETAVPPARLITDPQLTRNISRGIVDLTVGFPAQVASGALSLPEEVKSYVDKPELLKESVKQAGEMLISTFDPREYTSEKFYEDPVGRLALLGQAIGLGVGAKGLYKSLKKPVAPATVDMSHLSPERINEHGSPKVRVYEPQGPGVAYTSTPKRLLKREPFNSKAIIEEQPIAQVSETIIQPEPIVSKGKSLFPFLPEELAPDVVTPNPLALLPEAVQPKQATGFTGTLKSLKKINQDYPQSFSAKAPKVIDAIKETPKANIADLQVIDASKNVFPWQASKADILIGKVKGKGLKKVETLGTKDLIGEVFLDIGELLSSEKGAISTKKAESLLQKRAQRARTELLKRARNRINETGQMIDEVLGEFGLTPEQSKALIATASKGISPESDAFTKITASGEVIPLKRGGQTVPKSLIKASKDWKDIGLIDKNFKDMDRNLEKATGKDYQKVREFLIDPRESAVTSLIEETSNYKQTVKDYVGKQLGIKPRSKESAAVMNFGEGNLELNQLKKQFPKKWGNIVKADQFFRENYNKIITEVNEVLKSQGKEPIPFRKNYYTHANEIATLWDQLKTPELIDPQLSGVSEFTLPTGKWNPFAQKRRGGQKHVVDAIEAFDRYLMPTLSQKHLNPIISRYQAFADALAARSVKTRNLNDLIWSTRMHARGMAGKTNPLDRTIQDFIGRRPMKAIDWMSHRLGANQIIGNIGSAVMQSSSLPQSLAHAGLANTIKGMFSTVADSLSKENQAFKMSPYLRRRYSDVSAIRKGALKKAEVAASQPFLITERFFVESAWRANFNKAISKGLNKESSIKYADNQTIRQIGDRSIGAKPLAFQSRVAGLGLQFQFEVNNFLQRMTHDLQLKGNKAELARLVVYSYLFNQVYDALLSRKPIFDPLGATIDAITMDKDPNDDDMTDLLKRAGVLSGELLSNMPLGQTVASALPRDVLKKYMGTSEVGLYGGGAPLASAIQKGIKKPETLVTSFVTPFGGAQINKSLKGIEAIEKIPEARDKEIKMLAFGPSSDKEISEKFYKLKRKRKKKIKRIE